MTAATGLVTLFLAVAAVLLGKDFVLTNVWAQSLMIATVVALLLSAVCAVMGAFPRKYDAPSSEMLDEMVETNWGDAEVEAERVTAYANVKAIESLRKSTAIGVRYLIAAGVLQIAAVAALGGCLLAVAYGVSDVERAENAINGRPGMKSLLSEFDASGLLKTGDDVVRLTTYYKVSCSTTPAQQSGDALKTLLSRDLQVDVTVRQAETLELARMEFCAAQ